MFCNIKRLVTSPRHFNFPNFVHKKWLGAKEKIKSAFSWSLSKTTSNKSHTCIGCFGLFTKLKRQTELVFTAGFLHTFSIKIFLIKYPTRHSAGFFNYYLAGPQPTLGDFLKNSLTGPMVITASSIIVTWSTPGALKQVNPGVVRVKIVTTQWLTSD